MPSRLPPAPPPRPGDPEPAPIPVKGKALKPVPGKVKRKEPIPDSERGKGKIRGSYHHKVTPEVRARYLENLAKYGTKVASADAAGITYQALKNYLSTHPDFQTDIDEALERYRDSLLREVQRRGVEGWIEQPIITSEGEIVGYKTKYSDRLLEVALKRVDPESRETISKVEHSGSMVTAAIPFDVKVLEKLDKSGRDALRLVLQQIGSPDAGKPGADPSES